MPLKDKLIEIGKISSTDSSRISIFSSNTTPENLTSELKHICERVKNIKDAYKRKKIQGILSTIFDYVEDNSIPKNLAIFATTLKGGNAILEVLPIPKSVDFKTFQYYCDFEFKTDMVIEELWPSDKIGVILMFSKHALIYEFNFKGAKSVARINLAKGGSKSDYVSKVKKAIIEVAGKGNFNTLC